MFHGKMEKQKQKEWKGSRKEASALAKYKVQKITNSTQPYSRYHTTEQYNIIPYRISFLHSCLPNANILITCFLTFGEIAFCMPISKLHQSKTKVEWQQLLPLSPSLFIKNNNIADILVSVVLTEMMIPGKTQYANAQS